MATHVPTKPQPVRRAQQEGDQVARTTGFAWLARAGFAARGVIYSIVGVLAIKLALGDGGKTTNQQGALKTIAHQPFGTVMLAAVAVGLGGYALWRLVRAAIGHGPEGTDSGFDRLAALGSGIVYAGLCALRRGDPPRLRRWQLGKHPEDDRRSLGLARRPLDRRDRRRRDDRDRPLSGLSRAQRDFLDDSKTEEMSRAPRRWIEWIGAFGYLARMVVFGLVGVFLIKAAVDFNPAKAVGLDGALAKLANASYGPYALGIVAAGLIAFGLYSLSDARYHRI